MKGEKWIGFKATESVFKEKADEFKVLHLATHGVINDDTPMLSQLLFNRDSINDGLLNVSEIYGLSLNADLTVLSACNSGVGKSTKGEGNMSISRAFSYAGCPSVITTFWKVPDQMTHKLMQNLYENLVESNHKAESLRSAKLQFITSTDDSNKAHPYYWASFVLMGDHGEIEIGSDKDKYLWWLLALSAVLVLAFTFKKLIRKSALKSDYLSRMPSSA